MKRSRKLFGLLAVLALFIVAAYIARVTNPENKADDTTTENNIKYTILTIEPDMVDSITWTYNDSTLTFTHKEDTWSYADDSTFPLDASYIDSMLSSLNGIQASKIVEDVTDLSMYGLDNPICSINVDAGSAYSILIGNETALDGLRYVSIGDDNVYLVDSTLLSSFSYGLYDILATETVPTMSDITNVSITSETSSLFIEYLPESELAYSDEYVWFMKDGDSYLTLDTALTDTLISNITGLSLSECVNYNASDDELNSYGLAAPMVAATVTYIESEENKTFTLELGNYSDDNSVCYAHIAGSRIVYLIDGTVCDNLMTAGYDSLKPDEVLQEN